MSEQQQRLSPGTDGLRQAVLDIIEANNDFRAGMPADWEGDPLQDAINAASGLLLDDVRSGGVAQPRQVPDLRPPSPDFRVVPVRVLQSAYDRIDEMLAIDPDLRKANAVRIELRHLINETYSVPSTNRDGFGNRLCPKCQLPLSELSACPAVAPAQGKDAAR